MAVISVGIHEWSRWRLFLQAQLPFLASTLALSALAVVLSPAVLTSDLFIAGAVLAVVASAAIIAIPVQRNPLHWNLAVAVADLAALAGLQAVVFPLLPVLALTAIFPALWLAYRSPLGSLAVTSGGSLLVALAPFLVGRAWPTAPAEIAVVAMVPVLLPILHLAMWVVTSEVLAKQQQLVGVTDELRSSLRENQVQASIQQTVAQTVDAAICLIGANGRRELANTAHEQFLLRTGAAPGDLMPGPLLFAADRATPVPRDVHGAPLWLQNDFSHDLCWVGPEGDQHAYAFSARHVFDDGELLIGKVIVGADVTELADAVRVREEFLAAVSHELRTPLTSIVGYLELLEDDALAQDPALAPSFAVIHRNIEQLLARFAALSSAAQSDLPLRLDVADLAELVRVTVAEAEPSAQRARVTLTSGGRDAAPAVVDASRVRQALGQLLSNAVKFTSPGGSVSVHLSVEADHALIVVWDTGMGIAPEDQRQVFDRFFRARDARVGSIPGMGLGLAIVKTIADAHGGSIELTSSPGQGSLFALRLPLAAATAGNSVGVVPDHGVAA